MNPCYRLLPRTFLLCALSLLLAPASRAADEDNAGATARVKFSDPAKPGTLKLALPWAEARITGTEGNEVIVTSTLDQKGRNEVDHEGFRRLDTDVTFELTEKNNVAIITVAGDSAWSDHGAEFEIQVPRSTNLVLRTEIGGDVTVEGVDGDLDINSMNGDVVLHDIASSAVVNTLNGEIEASFKRAPVKAVSFSSMNGEIDVRLPGDSKANLRMRTHNGSIRTNFAEGVLQAKAEKTVVRTLVVSNDNREAQREMAREMARAEREQAKALKAAAQAIAEAAEASAEVVVNGTRIQVSPRPAPAPMPAPAPAVSPVPPIPPMPNFGGKSIVGTLNGGGVDINLTSMNGTITVREAK